MSDSNNTFDDQVEEWIEKLDARSILLVNAIQNLQHRAQEFTKTQRMNTLYAQLREWAEMSDEDFSAWRSERDRAVGEDDDDSAEPDELSSMNYDEIQGSYLKSIDICNFRCFYGTQSMEFSRDPEKPVTLLISATNGTGKTSFLNAFVWCLFGTLVNGTDIPEKLVNDRALSDSPSSEASITLELQLKDETYLVKRTTTNSQWTTKQGPEGTDVTVYKIADDNQVPSNIQTVYRSFPQIFRDLFFIPGETFAALDFVGAAGDGRRNIPLRQGIETLLNAKRFTAGIKDLEDLLADRRLSANQLGDQAMTNRQNKVDTAQAKVRDLEKQVEETEKSLTTAQQQETQLHAALLGNTEDPGNEYLQRRQKIDNDKHKYEIASLLYEEAKLAVCRSASTNLLTKALQAGVNRVEEARKRELIPPPFDKDQLDRSLNENKCRMCGTELAEEGKARITRIRDFTRDNTAIQRAVDHERSLRTAIHTSGPTTTTIEAVEKVAEALSVEQPAKNDLTILKNTILDCETRLSAWELSIEQAVSDLDAEFDSEEEAGRAQTLALYRNKVNEVRDLQRKLKRLEEEQIPAAKSDAENAQEELERAAEGNKEAEIITSMQHTINDAKEFMANIRDGLSTYGRSDLTREMNAIYARISDRNFKVEVNENFEISVVNRQNGEPADLNQAEKIMVFLSYVASLAKIAPLYQELESLETEGWAHMSSEDLPSNYRASFPVVLDAPTTPVAAANAQGLVEALPEFLPQLIITVFIDPQDQTYESIDSEIGKLYRLETHGSEREDLDVIWKGEAYPSTRHKEIVHDEALICEIR